jgi:hypothetical protein
VKRHATRRTGWWIPGALLLFAGVIGAGPAWACSCLSPEPDEFVAEIGILFRGALVSERQLPPSSDCGDQNCMLEGLFRVEESLKGTLGQTVRLTYYAPDFMCSPSFQVGQTVVVAGYGDAERGYETDDCTQFETTYDAEPSDAEAYPVLAAAARQRAWLATLAGAAEKDPGNPVPLIAQARFLAATSGTLEAIGLLDRALAADPLQRDAVLLKAEILSARKHDHQALALIEPYLSARPDDVEAKRQQVLSLIRIGRIADVAKDWRRSAAAASVTSASPPPISSARICPASSYGQAGTSRPPISPARTCGSLTYPAQNFPPRTSAAPICVMRP